MRRRAFGAGLLTSQIAARAQAQAPGSWRIGFLTPRAQPIAPSRDAFSESFVRGMSELGYVEGRNLAIDWRYADGNYQRLGGFAAELVAARPPVIVTYGTAAAKALKDATTTVPIVVAAANDLLGAGIVQSLAQPGGNITGLSVIDVDISGKQLELLKAASPRLTRAALLMNPGNAANAVVLKQLEASAPKLGVEIVAASAATAPEIEAAFAAAAEKDAGAVIVAADAFFSGQGERIAEAGLRHRLAIIGIYQDHVPAGCLMSYGQNVADFHRQAARYVDRILRGAKPTDLPIEQPTRFEFVINARTAATLGLSLPQTLLASADRVVE
jgi:putative ABC transport system substrate-binding protein